MSIQGQQNEVTRGQSDTKSFGVVRKDNGRWFGGFNKDQSVRWVDETSARRLTHAEAAAQAALLIRFGDSVQRKPVKLS